MKNHKTKNRKLTKKVPKDSNSGFNPKYPYGEWGLTCEQHRKKICLL